MTKKIPLTKGKIALVDDEDYDHLMQHKWHIAAHQYAARHTKVAHRTYKHIYMHRQILNAPAGFDVDHINGNGLDNRRCNLRLVTHRQNMQHKRATKGGRSQYKGVYQAGRRWTAEIIADRKIRLGVFDSEIEAAKAYDAAARLYHGEFAYTNFNKEGSMS